MNNNNNNKKINQGNEFSQFNINNGNNRSGLFNEQQSQEFSPNTIILQQQQQQQQQQLKELNSFKQLNSQNSLNSINSINSINSNLSNEKNLNQFYNTVNQQQLQQKQYQDAISNRKAQMFRSKSSPHVHSPSFSPMEISENIIKNSNLNRPTTTTTTTTTSSSTLRNKHYLNGDSTSNSGSNNTDLSPMLMSPVFNRLYSHSKSTLALDGNGLVNGLPEEVLVRIFKLLNVEDLYRCYSVCTLWKRLCEDEAIFRKVCFRNYPILKRYLRPPFENSWRKYYNLRKSSFLVLGGPTSQSTCMDDICAKLRQVGIGNVDSFYAQKRLPTLEELQKYTSILIYSYNSSAFLDGQLMGDVLSDYVDNGGGVVVTVFTNCNNLRNGFLKGRFLEQNYHPIIPARQHDTNGKKPLNLGKVHVPDHPILHGVKSLEGGRSSFFCLGALNPEAKLVAEWSNGVPLIADLKKKRGRVVALNFFPPSSDTGDPRFWNSSTDGSLMMANSLVYVGKSSIFRKARLEGASYVTDSKKDSNNQSSDSRNNSSSDLRNGDSFNQSNGNSSKRDKRHRFLSSKRFSFFKLFGSSKKNNINNQQQQNNP